MDNSPTSCGWLAPKVWLFSFFFWASYLLLTLSATFLDHDGSAFWEMMPLQSVPVLIYWIATPLLFEYVHRLGYRGRSPRQYQRGLLLAVLTAAGIATAILSGSFVGWRPSFYAGLLQTLTMCTVWVFHFFAIGGVAVAVSQAKMAQARREQVLSAELRALRSQLQPHFLFNSLQAISVTIKQDPNAAVHMVTLLGDLLRQTLRQRSDDLVSLQEEQQMLEPYLELQRHRFADRLNVELDLPSEVLGAAVPDLLLQPLVENALQHGIESMPGKGTVRVRARRDADHLQIEVADDGAGPEREQVDGIGLGATRARLRALYGDRAQLTLAPGSISGAVVTVRMPWQEVQGAA
ncbi:MAG: sensor histidine kinase [Planctomycetota bacterium]